MKPLNSIRPRALAELANPAAPGTRHSQILKIAISLISSGLDGETIFELLRPNYSSDVSSEEIAKVIEWAENHSGVFRRLERSHFPNAAFSRTKTGFGESPSNRKVDPQEAIRRFLNGFECEDVDLWERSPVRLSEQFENDAANLLSTVFEPGDFINIVSTFSQNGEKGYPNGSGITKRQEDWLFEIERKGPPKSRSGGWIRINPIDGNGISDANVASFRFLLLEFDEIPLSVQIPFVARLELPIAAIISSGGKSIHAWVRIAAPDLDGFRERADWIYRALAPFGLDTANRNPSRLSRLPGVYREVGGFGDKRQRLLYLNPKPCERGIFG